MTSLVYLSIVPEADSNPGQVTVHHRGTMVAIVASGDWTEAQFDAAVPDHLRYSYPGSWDYRLVDGHDTWVIDTQTLDKDGE